MPVGERQRVAVEQEHGRAAAAVAQVDLDLGSLVWIRASFNPSYTVIVTSCHRPAIPVEPVRAPMVPSTRHRPGGTVSPEGDAT